jgi:transcriptional regulator GlxA family with amidase domain
VKLLRLEKAKYLIENSFLEVKEIAAAVGIGDVSHFVRDYKCFYGETPSQTRTRKKAGSNFR